MAKLRKKKLNMEDDAQYPLKKTPPGPTGNYIKMSV